MTYAVLCSTPPRSAAEFAALPPDAKARRFDAVVDWLREHHSQIVGVARLEPAPQTASAAT